VFAVGAGRDSEVAGGRDSAVGAARDMAAVGSGGVWAGVTVEDGAEQAVNPTIMAAATQRAPRETSLLFMRFDTTNGLKAMTVPARLIHI